MPGWPVAVVWGPLPRGGGGGWLPVRVLVRETGCREMKVAGMMKRGRPLTSLLLGGRDPG
jgi:hypothetical protein